MNHYDYIFIGSSIPCLLSSTTINNNKKILIIEKDNYIGGAWRISCDKYKYIDLVGHLIVPTNNIIGDKIISFFKNIDLKLEYINKNDFVFETDTYKSNNKNGTPIIARNGWTDFFNKILSYVQSFKNINIITNTEVLKINYTKDNIILTCKNNNFICNKVIIPMYCNISKIYYNNTSIDIPYENIINQHILIDISYQNLNITKNYQAFLDKEPIGIIDRVTVSSIKKNNCILSCRISKEYKNKNKNSLSELIFPFLKEKEILNESCKINDIYFYNYSCNYRNAENNRNILYDTSDKLNKFYNSNRIYILNSIYMGHFLENLIEKKLKLYK